MGSVVRLAGLTRLEMQPPSPASSDGSTGMVPVAASDCGSAGRRDRRMIHWSRLLKGAIMANRQSPNPKPLELRVGVDVGSRSHHVAVGLSDGRRLDQFEIPHTAAGFREFFARIERHAKTHRYPIAVAMEGYNGAVQPLGPALGQPGPGPGLATFQRQQPEAGALQGDLSQPRQERFDRLRQEPGAVPAPRSLVDGRRCAPGSHGDARRERRPQAPQPPSSSPGRRTEARPLRDANRSSGAIQPLGPGFCRSPAMPPTGGS